MPTVRRTGSCSARPPRRIRLQPRTSCRSWTHFTTTSTHHQHAAQALDDAAALRGRLRQIRHQRRSAATSRQPGAFAERAGADHRAAAEVLADLHLPVPGRSVVPRERRPRRAGRQRQVGDHGRRTAVRRRPVPLPRQPAEGQRHAAAPAASPSCGSLPDPSKNFPVKYLVTDTGFGTGLDVRPNPGHRLPGLGQLLPGDPRDPRTAERSATPAAAGTRPAARPPRRATLRRSPGRARRYTARHQPGAPSQEVSHETTDIRGAVRVALFTTMCLVFVFILVTVFGQFRFDTRVNYSAVFTNVSGLKGGNFVRIAGVEVGKVTDLTLHSDGTVTVDFAVDKGPARSPRAPRPRCATRTCSATAISRWRRVPDRCDRLHARRDDPTGPHGAGPRRRRSHRRIPAAVPRPGPRPGQRAHR